MHNLYALNIYILISKLWTSPFSAVTFQFLLLMEYTYHSWYIILKLIIRIVQARSSTLTHRLSNQGIWRLPSRNVVTMNWLTLMQFHNSLLMWFHRTPTFLFTKCNIVHLLNLILTENLDITTGDTCVAEDAYSSWTPDPTTDYVWTSCRPCFSFI